MGWDHSPLNFPAPIKRATRLPSASSFPLSPERAFINQTSFLSRSSISSWIATLYLRSILRRTRNSIDGLDRPAQCVMSEANGTPNRRRARDEDNNNNVENSEGGTRKRRAFLQTMGQQLREFGVEGTSPQDLNRNTFGASPGTRARPGFRSTNTAANQTMVGNVQTPESDAAPGEDDQLPAGAAKSASKWLWTINEVLPPSVAGNASSLSFEDLLDMSQSYFDLWHPAFPFINAPSLIDYIRRITQAGLQLSASSPSDSFYNIILRSVMSISVADRRQMQASRKVLPSTLIFHSFNDAITSIQLVLTEESSILSLQALVSVQLFLITMHRYNAASRLEGLAVRLAFQLGLHRCPHRTTSVVDKESALRKRLLWSIYCIDRYICIRLGTPLGIRSDEMDVCFPHDEHHNAREDQGMSYFRKEFRRHTLMVWFQSMMTASIYWSS
jgi:hypothetical protein